MNNEAMHIIAKIKSVVKNNLSQFVVHSIKNGDLFSYLVAIVLTQNTSDRNAIKALKELEKNVGLDPHALLNAGEEKIKNAIKSAGLYNQRAKRLYKIAKKVVDEMGGDLSFLKKMPSDKAKKILLSFPGVGKKTADLMLLLAGKDAFPVDTHIKRITKRLGLVQKHADYDEISDYWRSHLPPELHHEAHMLLIQFGRKICKSKNPKCDICPLADICKFHEEFQ